MKRIMTAATIAAMLATGLTLADNPARTSVSIGIGSRATVVTMGDLGWDSDRGFVHDPCFTRVC